MASELTPKQESFCKKYIETGNASEAYRIAYDSEDMKPATINRKAKELLDNGKIAARLGVLHKRHEERHNVTVDSLTLELEEARALALRIEQPAAMVAASMGKAKLHGKIVNISDVTVRKPISEMTDDELAAYADECEREGAVLSSDTDGAASAED